MAIRIVIQRTRPDPSIPFFPTLISDMYAEIYPFHKPNIIEEYREMSEDCLTETHVRIWKDIQSLADWNQHRTSLLEKKEMMLIEYHRRMGITYWSWQEHVDD